MIAVAWDAGLFVFAFAGVVLGVIWLAEWASSRLKGRRK